MRIELKIWNKKGNNRITQMIYAALFLIPYSLFLSSCSVVDPPSAVPAYVRIDSIAFSTIYATQGSASHAIKDAWVFIDGIIIGAFEMPVNVPILNSGSHTISVKSGIIVNGIAATRTGYPFYSIFTQTINLQPGKVDTLSLFATYNNATFSRKEDFEGTGSYFIKSPESADTTHTIYFNTNPELCMEGNCLATLMDGSRPYFEFITNDSFPMPLGAGYFQYMELNYRGDTEFTVGLQSYSSTSAYKDDIVILKPSATWQKIYVSLNAASDLNPNAKFFKVYMRGVLPSGQATGSIYFDNIKVIHNG